MKSFDDISLAVLIVIILVVIFELWFVCENKPDEIELLDLDGNGYVSKEEIRYILHHLKKKKKPNYHAMFKSAMSGAIRGAMMGLLLNGMEGAVTGAVVFGVMNPAITGVEHVF